MNSIDPRLAVLVEALRDYVSRCPNCGGVGWYQVGEDSQEQCQWCDAGLIALHAASQPPTEIAEMTKELWQREAALAGNDRGRKAFAFIASTLADKPKGEL